MGPRNRTATLVLIGTLGSLVSLPAAAQSWLRTLGLPSNGYARGATTLADGGFAFAGGVSLSDPSEAWLVRLDAAGDVVWERRIGCPGDRGTSFNEVVELTDGDLLATGYCNASAAMARLTGQGDLIGLQSLEGSCGGQAYDVVAASDGGAYFTSYCSSDAILRLNSDGSLRWLRELTMQVGLSIDIAADGSVFAANPIHRGGALGYGGRVARVSAQGDVSWQAWRAGEYGDGLSGVLALPDGGVLAVGRVLGVAPSGEGHAWTVRLDGDGRTIAQHVHECGQSSGLSHVASLGAEGFLAVGHVVDDTGERSALLLPLALDGRARAAFAVGPGNALDVESIPGGGAIVVGATWLGAGGTDALLVRTDAAGLLPADCPAAAELVVTSIAMGEALEQFDDHGGTDLPVLTPRVPAVASLSSTSSEPCSAAPELPLLRNSSARTLAFDWHEDIFGPRPPAGDPPVEPGCRTADAPALDPGRDLHVGDVTGLADVLIARDAQPTSPRRPGVLIFYEVATACDLRVRLGDPARGGESRNDVVVSGW